MWPEGRRERERTIGVMPFIIVKLEAKWPQFEAQKLGLQNLDLVCYFVIT